jgi:hypothetical protein
MPFCLKKDIEDDIALLKQHGISLVFVFNGLDYVNKTKPDFQSTESRRVQDEAWHHYLSGDSKRTVADFGKAKYPVDVMTRPLQKILIENKVPFMVAPYSATAQVWLSRRCEVKADILQAIISLETPGTIH